MSDYSVTKTRLQAGVWEGVVRTAQKVADAPEVEVMHLGKPILGMPMIQSETEPTIWQLRIAVPPELLCDGVQVFLILDKRSGDKLASFTIVTGEPLEDDIRAETELLRAELDMLKRAFRRHCLETSQG